MQATHVKRSRCATVLQAVGLLWPVFWYVRDGDKGLLIVVAAMALGAVLFAHIHWRNARWYIWGGLLLGVVLLAINSGRTMPPEGGEDLLRLYRYDRAATIGLIPGILALWAAPGYAAGWPPLIAVMPMMMVVLTRRADLLPGTWGASWFVWLGLVSLVVGIQAHHGALRTERGAAQDLRGVGGRLSGVCGLVILAMLFSVGVHKGFEKGVTWLHGSLVRQIQRARQERGGTSYLSLRAPPGDFAGHVQPLMFIDAPVAPGYLREAVFENYMHGKWVRGRATARILQPIMDLAHVRDGWVTYRLHTAAEKTYDREAVWHVMYTRALRTPDLMLPAGADMLWTSGGVEVLLDDAGVGSLDGIPPVRSVEVGVDLQAASRMRIPMGVGRPAVVRDVLPPWQQDQKALLKVPEELGELVQTWLDDCEGLAGATNTPAAVEAIVRYFQKYSYDLEVPQVPTAGLLHAFQQNHRGHCTLFASAATLMLRARGIPARVVGGYYSQEWHPAAHRWVVRARNGHAWSEAWDSETGVWMLVEATPPVGLPEGFASPHRAQLWMETLRMWIRRFVDSLRRGDWVVMFVLWLASLFEALTRWRWWFAAAALILGVAWSLMWLRRLRKIPPDVRLRLQLAEEMQRASQRLVGDAADRRKYAESWAHWEMRVRPKLPAEKAAVLHRLVTGYQRIRYATVLDTGLAREWMAARKSG